MPVPSIAFRTNCSSLGKTDIPWPYLEKQSWRSTTWGEGVEPPAYSIYCALWYRSENTSLCMSYVKLKKPHNKQNPHFYCEGHQNWKRSPREVAESLSLEIIKTQRDAALSNLLDMTSNGAGWDDLQRHHLTDSVILYNHWEKLKTAANNPIPNFQSWSTWHLILN